MDNQWITRFIYDIAVRFSGNCVFEGHVYVLNIGCLKTRA